MGLLLILPFLVSGYILCSKNILIKYKLPQYEGQLLYFRVAYFGVICFIFSFLTVSVVSLIFSRGWGFVCINREMGLCWDKFFTDYLTAGAVFLESVNSAWKDGARVYSFLAIVGFFTILMPYPISWFSHWLYKRRQEKRFGKKIKAVSTLEAMVLRESLAHLPMTQLLLESSAEDVPVMVIMEDRKVYVGLVSSLGTPTEASSAEEDFGMRLFMGGYCDKDTMEIVLDPRYSRIEESHSNVFLKQKNISTAVRLTTDEHGVLEKISFPHRVQADPDAGKQDSQSSDSVDSEGVDSSVSSNLRPWMQGEIFSFLSTAVSKTIAKFSRWFSHLD
ncbi:hypothetical protein ABQZ99_005445 [Xanthomonas hortorum pv. vitians]|uniref:hypothetical protein n=1 Tax=Xanthomonas hortorum TaxID=56454 RepID=UPI0032E8CCDE